MKRNKCCMHHAVIASILRKRKLFTSMIAVLIILSSCKKFIEVQSPNTSINGINVFSTDATAAAVLTGIYTKMSNEAFNGGITAMFFFPALSSDELTLFDLNSSGVGYYRNTLTKQNGEFWSPIYNYVFIANSAIEGLSSSSSNGLTPNVKQQLMGEAKFIRAFCYFYLVNLYGDVPLALTTNSEINRLLPRLSKAEVYQQIISDLIEAKELLSSQYLDATLLKATTERVRPTKAAATALLSRSYLYINDWTNAEAQAAEVISNNIMYDTVALNNVFIKNSKEAIWELQPTGVTTKSNTKEGFLFILPSSGPSTSYPVYLSDNVLNAFEAGDQRKIKWVNSVKPAPGTTTYYFPYKYKIGAVNTTPQEYSMVMRLAEQYLIRAEARAQQGNIGGAKSDLNAIRMRAGLPNTTANDKVSLLAAILHERQVEFFTEWGHRWLDLKRTGSVDAVMSIVTPLKGGTWNPNWALYPIPQYDIDKNPNLKGYQNPGYQ